jgi:copper homeostasis protein
MTAQAQGLLEVIVTSIQDAVAAERGGADRLEIVRDLKSGGLTPSLALVRQIQRSAMIPVRVMLRQHASFAAEDARELENLVTVALQFGDAGVDGVVLGFVRDQRVDVGNTRAVLDRLNKMKATFHHAFDVAGDPIRAIEDLKKCRGIDRILTSGGKGSWEDNAGRLTCYSKHASPEITIMAGGGLNRSAIQLLLMHTPIREFHVGRAVRKLQHVDGTVQSDCVAGLARMIHSSEAPRELHGTS